MPTRAQFTSRPAAASMPVSLLAKLRRRTPSQYSRDPVWTAQFAIQTNDRQTYRNSSLRLPGRRHLRHLLSGHSLLFMPGPSSGATGYSSGSDTEETKVDSLLGGTGGTD